MLLVALALFAAPPHSTPIFVHDVHAEIVAAHPLDGDDSRSRLLIVRARGGTATSGWHDARLVRRDAGDRLKVGPDGFVGLDLMADPPTVGAARSQVHEAAGWWAVPDGDRVIGVRVFGVNSVVEAPIVSLPQRKTFP